MRSLMMSPVIAMVAMTFAATGHADINASKTSATTRPKIELAPTVKVVGFHRPPGYQNAAYAGGPLAVAVDVENTGNGPADTNVKLTAPSGVVMNAQLTVPAHSTRYVLIQDSEGLASSCAPKDYKIALSGAGTSELPRHARITPSCTFSSTLEETWNQMSPDHVEAEKKGNAYLQSPKIVSPATCGKPAPTVKVTVINHAAASSPSLIVQERDWSAASTVKGQTAAAFPIAANEMKEVVLTPVPSASEPSAKMKLTIVDWTKSLGGHTSDGGIFVNTTRSCSLDVDLL